MAPEPRRLHELPPIDPRTVALVRASVAQLPGELIALTEEFYRQLFTLAPHLRPMFPQDMSPQSEKLLSALLSTVQALDRPEQVEAALRRLGASHRRRHGVTNEMYPYVGHALVRSVSRLSGHMESSVGSAWIAVYEWMAAVMIAGAEEAASRAAPAPDQAPGGVPAEVTVARHADRSDAYPLRSARRVSSRPG